VAGGLTVSSRSGTSGVLERRRSTLAFWVGCVAVTVGVLLHLPMFLMGRHNGYVLVGMPMDAGMMWGMVAIVAGIALAAYGLMPRFPPGEQRTIEAIAPPEDAPLTRRHWQLCGLLAIALVVDIMKPATLGFVTPGMRIEYGLDDQSVAWLPLAALTGTVTGSFAWGALADFYGRRAAILLSSVMFVGTSICGAMPSFDWNVGMCFLMGAAAGGMLPVVYALLAEIMPTRHRGASLVLIGAVGAVGGYFAASALSALLQPTFGWRILWLVNMPTGLLLVVMSPLLPESPRFLQRMGRAWEARVVLARFGVTTAPDSGASAAVKTPRRVGADDRAGLIGITTALTLTALAWGLINFGVMLWLPGALVAEGHSVAASSALIARATLFAAPVALAATWLYSRWSTRGSLLVMIAIAVAGLLALWLRAQGGSADTGPVLGVTLLLVGACGLIAILLPYAAENYPIQVRGRASGWVAGCSKLGGVLAQGLSVAGVVPPFGLAALGAGVPAVLALALVARFGHETRGRDLRDIDGTWSADSAQP
jgi:putative MFS transporter